MTEDHEIFGAMQQWTVRKAREGVFGLEEQPSDLQQDFFDQKL